jgi:hypothetical protein
MMTKDIIWIPSDNYCLKSNVINYNAWHLHIHKHIIGTTIRVQRVKHVGIYPLQDFECLTNGMGKLNNMTIHGGGNAPRTLT